jgi:ABC-type transport system substrate-binding protein
LDRAARRALYGEVLRRVDAEVPNIWLFDRTRFDAVAADVQGVRSNGWSVLTWNVQDWYLRSHPRP